jgi:processive 1,2-diacylglycerol beta-glucosyltransferase
LDRPIVLVLGGGLGLGVDAVAGRLLQSGTDLQLVFMPGRNHDAQNALVKLESEMPERVRVCGWTDRMDLFIRASDVVVGKPGGVSVAEVLACGRPLFATRSLGGQEGFNVAFLERNQVGGLVQDGDLLERVTRTLERRDDLAEIQRRAWSLGSREGTQRVTEMILDLSWAARSKMLGSEH